MKKSGSYEAKVYRGQTPDDITGLKFGNQEKGVFQSGESQSNRYEIYKRVHWLVVLLVSPEGYKVGREKFAYFFNPCPKKKEKICRTSEKRLQSIFRYKSEHHRQHSSDETSKDKTAWFGMEPVLLKP